MPHSGLLIDAPIRINLTTCQNTFVVIGHCFKKLNKTGLVSGLSSHKHIHTERGLGRVSKAKLPSHFSSSFFVTMFDLFFIALL